MQADEAFDCESSSDEDEDLQSNLTKSNTADADVVAAVDVSGVQDDAQAEEHEEEVSSEEEEELGEQHAAATADSEGSEDPDCPDWLVEACDDVGLQTPTGTQTPPLEEKKLSLRERLAAVKSSKGVDTLNTAVARKVEFVAAADEVAYLKEEVTKLRRTTQMQAHFIETLKQKNEVLEQRLALREQFDTED